MSNEIFFDGKQYISANDASALSGLTRDYIARLCREGKLLGKRVGKNWYAENASLRSFLVGQEYNKSLRREALARERAQEYQTTEYAPIRQAQQRSLLWASAPVSSSHAAESEASEKISRIVRKSAEYSSPNLSRSLAVSPMYEKLSAAVAKKGQVVFDGAANLSVSPFGFADAAARLAAQSAMHVPAYAITPVGEFMHKLVALTLAFMLTFGTYALVDPRSAHFAGESAKDAARSLRATYDSVTGGGMQNLTENVQSQVALAAENPSATFASASAAIGNFVPQAAASLARAVHTRVNALVYAIAFPQSLINFGGGSSGGSVAVNIAPYAAPRSGPPGEHSAKQNVVAVSPSTIIQNPIRERTVEVQRIVAESGGITEEELNERLNQLNNKLVSQIYSITAVGGSTPVASGGITNMIAATNRIDQLSGAAITGGTITGTTISGGSISGTSVSATTLSSSGDTSLASTTVNGDLTVTGAVNFTGTPLTAVNAAFVSATSTNLFATSSVFVSATTTNFFATNANFTNSTSTNSYSSSLVAGNATSTNQFTTNLVATSATTTNFFSTLGRFTTGIVDTLTSTLATITGLNVTNSTTTNATSTNAFNTNLVATSATSTNSYVTNSNAANSTSTNLNATAAVFTNATSTNLFSTLAHFTTGIIDTFTSTLATITGLNVTNSTTTNATSTNAFSTNLVATNATSTNFFATNASTTNATSTTLFSVLSNFTTSIISTLTAVAATITDLVAPNLTATNATTTNATSTNAYASNLNAVTASTTNLTASGAVVINSTTTNATSTNLYASKAAFDAATSTSLFSTTASSTNLFSTNGNIGVLSAGSLTLSSALSVSSGGTGASSLGASQLVYGNGTGAVATVATSTLSTGTGLVVSSGSLGYQVGGSAATIGFAAIAANSLWANMTGAAAVPTVVSTSSLFTWTGTGDVVRGTSPTLVTPTISGGTFTGTQSLAAASTSLLSVFQNAYFGATATTTIDSTGAITVTSTSKNTFPYASSTALSVSGTGYFGTASTTNLTVSSLTANRIPYVAAAGAFTDSANLTFDGSALALTGSATISSTLGVTGLASFTQASTTRLSVTDRAYFGGTATSTFDSTGALTLVNALTYGGVTLSNAVTGTGNMVLSASPTFTGTIAAAALNTSGVITSTATGANTFPYASSTALTVSGHCVTADTRLRRRRRRSDGSYEYDEPEIVDIEEGDEIQSLDERTGELVWSRVEKLMFMGVKQTYRITTEDGRTIRTTAEHPYLVKNAKGKWLKHRSALRNLELRTENLDNPSSKLQAPSSAANAAWATVANLREGDEIAVADYSNTPGVGLMTKPSDPRITMHPSSAFSSYRANRFDSARLMMSGAGGWMRSTTIPAYRSSGYMSEFRKSLSWVISMRHSISAIFATSLSEAPRGTYFTSPSESRNSATSLRTFSSTRNCMLESEERTSDFGEAGSETERGGNMLFGKLGIGAENVLGTFAGSEHLEHEVDHDARTLENGFAMGDAGVGSNVFGEIALLHNANSIAQKENTALASGVPSIVPHMVLQRARLVHANIANPTWMSSEENSLGENLIQPPRGLEPLGHRMTSLALHHADGLRQFYHELQMKNAVGWAKIRSIEPVAEEDVYDVEIEGTHNFVAGHYVDQRTGVALPPEQENVLDLQKYFAPRQNLELGTWNLERYTLDNDARSEFTAKLRETSNLARRHGVDVGNLQNYVEISENGSIRIDEPIAQSGKFRASEYRGGKRQGRKGVRAFSHHGGDFYKRGVDRALTLGTTAIRADRRTAASSRPLSRSHAANTIAALREATRVLKALSSKLQVPEPNCIGFGGIIAHNTYLGTVSASGLSTLGQASTTLFSSYGPAYFGGSATSSFSSAGVLSLATDLAVSEGGTGASTLTGLLQGNGTSAFTAITNSSTGGQVLRVTGASTYAWGALDLADTDAITGDLPFANLAQVSAGSVLANITGSTADATSVATTSLFTWTGTGDSVRATSPTLITPALGTPSSGTVTNLTGTASININGTVGASTPTTGAFTTIAASGGYTQSGTSANTFTGTPTFSNATYSALFTGGNVGIGTTSPTTLLSVYGGNTGKQLSLVGSNGGAGLMFIDGVPGGSGYYNWQVAGQNQVANALTITPSTVVNGTTFTTPVVTVLSTGNVGIGTTSPVSKLSVLGESAFAGGASVGIGYAGTAAPTGGLIIQGNIGIGETAPGSKLSVSGGGSFGSGYDTTAAPTGGLIIEGNVGIGTTSPNTLMALEN
ncbi:MAG: hypothetical protein AAB927_02520, partial [Patescibacteria group bacterium]